jgi:hypothetical protein
MELNLRTIREYFSGQDDNTLTWLEQWRDSVIESNMPFFGWNKLHPKERLRLHTLCLEYIEYMNDFADYHLENQEYEGEHRTDNTSF